MMFKKVVLVVALIILGFSLVGCQTVKGLGNDISWMGQKGSEVLE